MPSVIGDLNNLNNIISAIDPNLLKNANNANALSNKIDSVLTMIDNGDYQNAINKLTTDILPKTNGCAVNGSPDNNDWIKDCPTQELIYPMVIDTIAKLQLLI